MVRVTKPGGKIILLENSRSVNPVFGIMQDISEPIITPFSKGCRWNVNVPAIAEKAKLKRIFTDSKDAGLFYLGVYEKI